MSATLHTNLISINNGLLMVSAYREGFCTLTLPGLIRKKDHTAFKCSRIGKLQMQVATDISHNSCSGTNGNRIDNGNRLLLAITDIIVTTTILVI